MKRSFQALVAVCAFAIVLAVCIPADAQRGGRGQGGRGGQGGQGGFRFGGQGGGWMGLLQNEAVQEEIDLIDDQLDEIEEIQADMHPLQEVSTDQLLR